MTASFVFMKNAKLQLDWWIFGCALFMGLASLIKAIVSFLDANEKDSTNRLVGPLQVLRAQLNLIEQNADVRLTVHVPNKKGTHLVQAIDYIGNSSRQAKGTARRKVPVNAGIIGRAFREKEMQIAHRNGDRTEDYLNELVTKWSFDKEAAAKVDTTARSWVAIPLFAEEEEVVGVLYADSRCPDFFKGRSAVNICYTGARGIARTFGCDVPKVTREPED